MSPYIMSHPPVTIGLGSIPPSPLLVIISTIYQGVDAAVQNSSKVQNISHKPGHLQSVKPLKYYCYPFIALEGF
jgi:hypothetical protein